VRVRTVKVGEVGRGEKEEKETGQKANELSEPAEGGTIRRTEEDAK